MQFMTKLLIISVLTILSCVACGNNNEQGIIDKKTDEVADTAVQKIQAPINKAKEVQDILNKQTTDREKQSFEQ